MGFSAEEFPGRSSSILKRQCSFKTLNPCERKFLRLSCQSCTQNTAVSHSWQREALTSARSLRGQGNRTCLSVQGEDWNGARAEVRVLVGIMGEARCRPSRAHTHDVKLLLHQGTNFRHPIPLQLNGKSNGTQLNCDCHTTAPRGKTFCDRKRNFRLIPASEREPCGKLH